MHKWSEAERFHQAALEVEPNHVATHVSYGTMLARNVSERINKTKEKFSINSETYSFLLQSSRTSEAELWFKRALKLAPHDSSVNHHYGEL